HKSVNPEDFDENAPYATNLLMRGTMVVEGSATARVVAVGDHTEIGQVAHEATALTGEKTPLNKQLDRLAGFISKVGYTVACLTFVIFTVHELMVYIPTVGVWAKDNYWHVFGLVLENFMMAVTLIVMAVPEGLPMAVTLSLALNMRRMLKTNNLVRKMHACETMGAITVICTDKTGTLTQTQMTVAQMLMKKEDAPLLYEAVACNTTAFLNEDRTEGLGNPTEVALLLWMEECCSDYMEVRKRAEEVARQPFSSELKYMATIVSSAVLQRKVVYVKGAPEIVLGLCKGLSAEQINDYQAQLKDWQMHAQRTLLLAYKEVTGSEEDCAALVQAGGLTLLGLTAISDPVRPEVPKAVKNCLSAGVNIKVVTGDSTGTAVEIARQIGLWTSDDGDRNCMKGADFASLSDEEALRRIRELKVMSRARPLDKQRLVRLLQSQGEVVAVTGDGTNDAPALNFAQVGLSMGSGTSVAKEASDITLLDDSFRSIVTAVMWGRSLYKNIQRFVMFQLTINLTALLVVLIGAFVGTALPLTVTQMLWVNIIMDTFAALALASLPADPKVMLEKPRPVGQFIITQSMWASILGYGLFFVAVLLAMLLRAGRGGGMNVYELTVFFTFFVLLQFWNLLNVKTFSTTDSAFYNLHKCSGILTVLGLILVGQWLIVQIGGPVFRTVPLTARDWGLIIVSTSAVLWVGEIVRLIKRLCRKKNHNGSKYKAYHFRFWRHYCRFGSSGGRTSFRCVGTGCRGQYRQLCTKRGLFRIGDRSYIIG
ncbi:MAG: calcium-translocating P-type ATPase, PMCA-type, partial [Paraprevotella sp.]|nr:calcium-translocating P-type ATPase, PMCA-type [Paraprevotella sp.]